MSGCDPFVPDTIYSSRLSFGGLYSEIGASTAEAYYRNPSGTPNIDETRGIMWWLVPPGTTVVRVQGHVRGSSGYSSFDPFPDGVQEYKWEIRRTTFTGVAADDFEPAGQVMLTAGTETGIIMDYGDSRNDLATFTAELLVTDFYVAIQLVNVSDEGGYLTFPPYGNAVSPWASDHDQGSRIWLDGNINATFYGTAACSQDDFNRTVSNDWGSPWGGTITSFDSSHASVTPNYGQMVVPAGVEDIIATSTGGWQSATGFTMTTQVSTSEVYSGAGANYIEFLDQAGSAFDVYLDFSDTAGWGDVYINAPIPLVDGGTTKTDWQPDTWYNVKMDYRPGGSTKVKVWEVDTPEPGAWLITKDAGVAPTGSFVIAFYSESPSTTFRIGPLNFAYAECSADPLCSSVGPCGCAPYVPCPPIRFDDFNRSVAPNGAGTSPSPYNLAYTMVSSGGANEDYEVFDEGDSTGWGLYMGAGPPASASGYLHTTSGAGGPWIVSEWTWRGRFTFSLDLVLPVCTLAIVTSSGAIGLNLGGTDLSVADLDDNTNGSIAFSWDISAQYLWKLHFQAGVVIEAKVWVEGTPEPAYQVYGPTSVVNDGNAYLFMGEVSTLPGPSANPGSIFIDWIEFCDTTEPTPNQPIEDEAVGIGDGSTTTFTTAWPYNPVSLEPEVDGIHMAFDPTDPASRQFDFITAPGAGTRVTASYRKAQF